jgi:hypothetical protein
MNPASSSASDGRGRNGPPRMTPGSSTPGQEVRYENRVATYKSALTKKSSNLEYIQCIEISLDAPLMC